MTEVSPPPQPVERSPIGPTRHAETTATKKSEGVAAPKLPHILTSLELLRPVENERGETRKWKDLHKEVKPWNTGMELADNVRDTVTDWIRLKVPVLKAKIPEFARMTEKSMTEAIAHGWFEGLQKEPKKEGKTPKSVDISGDPSEVLLTTITHVAKRVETGMFLNILQNATSEQLKQLGLNTNTAALTRELMQTSLRADPFFIRYMAYAGLSGDIPEKSAADSEALLLPHDKKGHSFRELFPKETKSIGKGLGAIARPIGEDGEPGEPRWISEPGGKTFQKYIDITSQYYLEGDPAKAKALRLEGLELYKQSLRDGFPVILITPTDESVKAPYIDPELKVALRSPDAKAEEEKWIHVRDEYAASLGVLGTEDQSDHVRDQMVLGSITIGAYASNLYFDAVAQENPSIQIYLNSQARASDRDFPKDILNTYIMNTGVAFGSFEDDKNRELAEFMSRTNTVMHELGHWVYPEGSTEDSRFGDGNINRTMQELKAELVYRALVPSMIEKGALPGTKEQWAVATLGASLQLLRDNGADEEDDYFRGAAFHLNAALAEGIVARIDHRLQIVDYDRYFDLAKRQANQILDLYKDPNATPKSAEIWIKQNTAPSDETKKVLKKLQ